LLLVSGSGIDAHLYFVKELSERRHMEHYGGDVAESIACIYGTQLPVVLKKCCTWVPLERTSFERCTDLD
jgi:hypothetical protein